MVSRLAHTYKSDHYCKRFYSWDHLITMLFATFSQCQSLREITTGMLAAEHKLQHLGLRHTPRRSTLSDANKRRPEQFFADLYHQLVKQYVLRSPDSRRGIYIVDSTTISLFSDVLANAGRPGSQGTRKGGVKAHTLIHSAHNQAEFVRLTSAASHDTPFLRQLNLPPGSIICFDKGYVDYKLFAHWSGSSQNIGFVSRLKRNAVVEILASLPITQEDAAAGVISDSRVRFGHTSHKRITRFEGRLVHYRDPESDKEFKFISNLKTHDAAQIAHIYRQRWQIELLFKRIKGAYPLRYFLGETPNAIKIQIWCALIADLLIGVLQRKYKKKWSYANLRAMIRLHCLSYVELKAFLEDPVKALLKTNAQQQQNLSLFPP